MAYPAAPYTVNLQSTLADGAGDTTDAKGSDYNAHDTWIKQVDTDLRAAAAIQGAVDITALVTAMLAGYTDGHVRIDGTQWVDAFAAGEWTHSDNSFVRVPKNGDTKARSSIAIEGRDAAGRGAKVTSVEVAYTITAFALAVDVTLGLGLVTFGGHGVARVITAPAVTFDSNHDSALKRRALGEHTMTLTVDVPAFLATRTAMLISMTANDTGGGAAALKLHGADVFFTRVPLDGS